MIALCSLIAPACADAGSLHPAAAKLAHAFDDHAVVLIGEQHRNVQQHEFLRALIRDPVFACRIDDIVVEFGNARLQKTVDAWTAGEDVAIADLERVWRETEVPFAWNSPVYRAFYDAVRGANRDRVCDHRLRIVAAGPPIDWSRIGTAADFARIEDRDAAFVDVIEREVLAKHHHALVVAGEMHALGALPDEPGGTEGPTLVQTFAKRHPGAMFSVFPVIDAKAAKSLGMDSPPDFRAVHGSPLAEADFALVAPAWSVTQVVVDGRNEWRPAPAKHWPRMGEVVDGLLWLGGDRKRAFAPPRIYLDPAYQVELRRRIAIIKAASGQDFGPMLDDLIADAKKAH